MTTPKDPIKLRQRAMASGRISLYLDSYWRGRRKCEHLRLYLIPETCRADKEENRKTLALAETIRAQRLIELRNNRYNLNDELIATPRLIDYYNTVVNSRAKKLTANTMGVWHNAGRYLKAYCKGISIADVDKRWAEGFVSFMLGKGVAINSMRIYISKVNAMFRQAVADGLIRVNPLYGVEIPRQTDTHREALTLEELRELAATPCKDNTVKRAFLFSCLTGLRRSDVLALRWRDVRDMGGFTRIDYRQQKTQKAEYLDLSPQAVQYMDKRGRDGEQIFKTSVSKIDYYL